MVSKTQQFLMCLWGCLVAATPACGNSDSKVSAPRSPNSGGQQGTDGGSGADAGGAEQSAGGGVTNNGGTATTSARALGGGGTASGGAMTHTSEAVGSGGTDHSSSSGVSAGGGSGVGGAPSTGGSSGAAGALPLPPPLRFTRQYAGAINDIWGTGPDNIYAVGQSGTLLHSTGDGKWTTQDPKTTANLTGVWGTGPNDIYVSVESNFILHSTGDGTWVHQSYASGYVFYDIWGSGTNDVYAVAGGAAHSTGNGIWSSPPQSITGGPPVKAIWGSAASDVYVATANTNGRTIYHSTGDGNWTPQNAPDVAAMLSIYGADAQHVYAAGGNIVTFSSGDGNWTTQLDNANVAGGGKLHGLWAATPDAIYACTEFGTLYRSNGRGVWSDGAAIDASRQSPCYAIWGTGVDSIYVAGLGIYHGVP